MLDFMINRDKRYTDIIPIFAGEEYCESEHSFGPYVRSCYLIHYCISGKGVFTDKRGTHSVSHGEFFIIRPSEVTTYTADRDDPWHYVWIGFLGSHTEIIPEHLSVSSSPAEPFLRLTELIRSREHSPRAYAAILHDLFYRVFEDEEAECDSIALIKRYIDYNYMRRIGMEELSALFAFERSYIYRMFISRYGISPKAYLTSVRISRAKELLSSGYSVGATAQMVGYSDAFGFSRSFKEITGITPSKWKENAHRNKQADL